jgi:MYXO-CTERM domain-containing protein
MITALAATLLTITTAAVPAQQSQTVAPAVHSGAYTLSTMMPTPGAWALMGMGGVALIRSRRDKR